MRLLLVPTVIILALGCSGAKDDDVAAARKFERMPLYWLGGTFEGLELTEIGGLTGPASFVVLIYGTCRPEGGPESSCALPLQIQISPLCEHLTDVARAPIWKTRRVRGAPVGEIDSAPVLFTRKTQIKVYRGDVPAGTVSRALKALRSLNEIQPIIAPGDSIPGPPPGVLEGTKPCAV